MDSLEIQPMTTRTKAQQHGPGESIILHGKWQGAAVKVIPAEDLLYLKRYGQINGQERVAVNAELARRRALKRAAAATRRRVRNPLDELLLAHCL